MKGPFIPCRGHDPHVENHYTMVSKHKVDIRWCSLWRFRWRKCVTGVSIGVVRLHSISSSLSLFHINPQGCQLSASCCGWLPWCIPILWNCNTSKHFFFPKFLSVMWFCHMNIEVTNPSLQGKLGYLNLNYLKKREDLSFMGNNHEQDD